MPSLGFDDASSRISLRSRITSATLLMITSRRAVIRYGFGSISRSCVLSFPKFIPEPVVPTLVFAPLFAGAWLELASVMRWPCVSIPLPCPKATVDPANMTMTAKKRSGDFMIAILIAREKRAGDIADDSPNDRESKDGDGRTAL